MNAVHRSPGATGTPRRIAMWSGPRNISTALMRSWENRPDTAVVDEPFYGHYLRETGIEHPGREAVMASMECDWRVVARQLTEGPAPDGAHIYYQKHMCHHFLPGMEGEWLGRLENVFLIREPKSMLVSLAKILDEPGLFDTGLEQQVRLYETVADMTGEAPVVIDAVDILSDPRRALAALCERLGLAFDQAMLTWPAGARESDGIWGRWWYANVQASTGFQPYRSPEGEVPEGLEAVYEECLSLYRRMAEHRMSI